MTDEERIARLTELARRVWPDRDEQKVIAETTGSAMIAYRSPFPCSTLDGSEGERPVSYHTRIDHPRALDALEAALLVLSGETSLRALELAGLPRSMGEMEREMLRLHREIGGLAEALAREGREPAKGGQQVSVMTHPAERRRLRTVVAQLRAVLMAGIRT